MSSIDHIHSETKMLQVEDHLNLLSAQYLVQCLDTDNVCHHITKMDLSPREMKETISHQTLSNRVTTASKQQEKHTPGTSHLICQYSNRKHEGQQST